MTHENIPVFELENVTHNFGNLTVLKNINLKISLGEKVALIGLSGAGKSTLISLLNGTLFPSQGIVKILGKNSKKLSANKLRQLQQKIGTIYQQFHLVDNLKVIHNVNAGHLGRWSFFQAAFSLMFPLEIDTALKALTQVGIPEKIYFKTNQLSGGQQQRVALARVIVQNPLIILADEPVSNLDQKLSQEVMNILTYMSNSNGKTLVVSLHSLELAISYCDRLIGLRQGEIIFDAAPQDISPEMISKLYEINF